VQKPLRFALLLLISIAECYGQAVSANQQNSPASTPTSPPATKMEAFEPAVGSVVTMAYDNFATGIIGISVDAREMRDSKGSNVRGLVVEVRESEYRTERSFVDTDEIPELLKGIDALLAIQSNPTAFKNFEVRYKTKGGLQLTAYNASGSIAFAVQAGKTITAQKVGVTQANIMKLRDSFALAAVKLMIPTK
jgi:hypothetical protein